MGDRAHVACGACRECCRGEAIMLLPGDDPSIYLTEEIVSPIDGTMQKFLIQKPNGDCIYLGETGCTIYDKAPQICRSFDCAALFKKIMSWPKVDRRHPEIKKMLAGPVLKAGRQRAGG